jgi:hypothetical protein
MREEADAEAAAPKRVNATVEKRMMIRGWGLVESEVAKGQRPLRRAKVEGGKKLE